jgi:hypothetical protein
MPPARTSQPLGLEPSSLARGEPASLAGPSCCRLREDQDPPPGCPCTGGLHADGVEEPVRPRSHPSLLPSLCRHGDVHPVAVAVAPSSAGRLHDLLRVSPLPRASIYGAPQACQTADDARQYGRDGRAGPHRLQEGLVGCLVYGPCVERPQPSIYSAGGRPAATSIWPRSCVGASLAAAGFEGVPFWGLSRRGRCSWVLRLMRVRGPRKSATKAWTCSIGMRSSPEGGGRRWEGTSSGELGATATEAEGLSVPRACAC